MANPFLSIINSSLPEPHASLLSGILFGTKATMPKDFYQSLVTTGVLHVIALSGMNISILVSLMGKLTRSWGNRISAIVTTCLIAVFVLFVGASPSIVRAAIMGCLTLFAGVLGRRNFPLFILILSGSVMILFDFSLIKSLSFQLSFFATLGILLADKKGECDTHGGFLNQCKTFIKENLRTTLSAQIFTVPIIAVTFHRISLVAPFTNLLTEWVIQPIMILGFLQSLMGYIWLPFGKVIGWVVWVPLEYFIRVIETLSHVPGASIGW
jgi:competence protein ComEC